MLFRSVDNIAWFTLAEGSEALIPQSVSVAFPATGVNQWDEETELGNINSTNGENSSSSSRIRTKNYIPVQPGGKYYFYNGSGETYALRYYGENKEFISAPSGATASAEITIPTGVYYMRFVLVITEYGNNVSVNYPSSVTTYQPYTNTAYGGTLDLSTGVLTVDRMMADLGDFTWGKSSRIDNGFVATGNMPEWWYVPDNDNKTINAIADRYVAAAYGPIYQNPTSENNNGKMAFRAKASGKGLLIVNSDYADDFADFDANTFKTKVAGQKVVLVLQTPIVYQLTPAEILSLANQTNVLWSDLNGDLTVKYQKKG